MTKLREIRTAFVNTIIQCNMGFWDNKYTGEFVDAIVAEAVRQAGDRTREGDREVTNLILDACGRLTALEEADWVKAFKHQGNTNYENIDKLESRIAALEQPEPWPSCSWRGTEQPEPERVGVWRLKGNWLCNCINFNLARIPAGYLENSKDVDNCPDCNTRRPEPVTEADPILESYKNIHKAYDYELQRVALKKYISIYADLLAGGKVTANEAAEAVEDFVKELTND